MDPSGTEPDPWAALRDVDETDFANALEALAPPRRAWLRKALRTTHPGHPWIARL